MPIRDLWVSPLPVEAITQVGRGSHSTVAAVARCAGHRSAPQPRTAAPRTGLARPGPQEGRAYMGAATAETIVIINSNININISINPSQQTASTKQHQTAPAHPCWSVSSAQWTSAWPPDSPGTMYGTTCSTTADRCSPCNPAACRSQNQVPIKSSQFRPVQTLCPTADHAVVVLK